MTGPGFAIANLEKWKLKLEKELKAPFSFENLSSELDSKLLIEPLYDADSNANLAYLKDFHKQWLVTFPAHRPTIRVGSHALVSATAEVVSEAESLHFQAWFGPSFKNTKAGLPHSDKVESNEVEGEWDPATMALLSHKNWKNSFQLPAEIHIHASEIHDLGASAVQELAFGLLLGEYYLQNCPKWPKIRLHLGLSPLFWLELAKCRAARLLWMNFASINSQNLQENFHLIGLTSRLHWSKNDVDINLIRHSVEAMAGVLGGLDEIRIFPHSLDESIALESTRLAANIALLCLEEAHLSQYPDPASGSFWVEEATHKLAESAWNQFLTWQKIGFENLLESGQMLREIDQNRNLNQEKINKNTKVWVGENSYLSPLARKSTPNF
jgi:hypothetical protein